jgi:hypothetical protein
MGSIIDHNQSSSFFTSAIQAIQVQKLIGPLLAPRLAPSFSDELASYWQCSGGVGFSFSNINLSLDHTRTAYLISREASIKTSPVL